MGQWLARDPDLGRLGVALMEIDQRLVIGAYLHARVYAARDDAGAPETGDVDAIDVVAAALFDDGVDTLRIRTPRIRADGERPAGSRVGDRPHTGAAVGDHQPHTVGFETGALHREGRRPPVVGRKPRCVVSTGIRGGPVQIRAV